MTAVSRNTVDLSAYPDLVVIYLGLRVKSLRGLARMLSLGSEIQKAVDAKPDGLLRHEPFYFSIFPLHGGMRQYWRDFDSLEKWAKALPHQKWWVDFLKDAGGVGFWHETYFMNGRMEAVYDDMPDALGFTSFAPVVEARGPMFSARARAGR
jgi:hypothetical protein